MLKKGAIILFTLFLFAILLVLFVTKTPKVYADLQVNASFTTQNTAPSGAIELRIQDFPTSFDACDVADQGDPVNYTDTHWRAGYGPDQGPNLTWTELADAEDAPLLVKTMVCISSTAILRDAATQLNSATNCDIFNRFIDYATAIEPNSIILNPANGAQNFNSTVFVDNRTVYVKLVAIDSASAVSKPYACDINITNAVPDSNSTGFRTQDLDPNDANTHWPTPIVNWTDSSDKDDGLTIDHYPADELDYILFIGDAPGEGQRISKSYVGDKITQLNFSEALQSEWDLALTLTNPTPSLNGYMNQTYYYRIITSDQFLHSINDSGANGDFQFWDFLPQVRSIAISQLSIGGGVPQYCNQVLGCTIDPLTHSNVTGLNFNITVYDLDDDVCANKTYSGTVRLCLNNTALSPSPITCNNALANFTFRLDIASPAGVPNYCNLSMSQYQGPQPTTLALGATPPFFFQPSKMYKILANITSNLTYGGYQLTGDTNATQNWTYNIKIAATFLNELAGETQTTYVGGTPPPAAASPSSGIINYNMTNWANAQFSLTWNTSYFQNPAFTLPIGCAAVPGGAWTPDLTNFFRLDDDGGLGAYNTEPGIQVPQGGTGNLQALSLSATLQTYGFEGGIRRCWSYGCNKVFVVEGLNTFQTNETLMHWWHIFPPSGLCPGTWIANLTFVATQLPGQ